MRPVHAFASQRHFVDHLAPIWHALDPDERGTFYVHDRTTAAWAATRRGLDVTVTRTMPGRQRTEVAGHQPHVLVASSSDLASVTLQHRRRAVFVEHGAGQTYRGVAGTEAATSGGYAGGEGRSAVDLFLCPNPTVAAANAARYRSTPAVVVGCPKLDRFAGFGPHLDGPPAVAWHWDCKLTPETRTAWPHYRPWWETARPQRIIGHAHPRIAGAMSRWWPTVGAEWQPDLDAVLERCGVFAADNTSAMFEAVALGIPVVVLNAPWYRRHVDHGLRFWEFADMGPQVDEPGRLVEALDEARTEPEYRIRRAEVAAAVFGPIDGKAAVRAVDAMREHLP